LVVPEEAAAICDVDVRTVYRWIEMGEAHGEETDGMRLRICLASLVTPAAGIGCELRIEA
jgi:hypothetical protein